MQPFFISVPHSGEEVPSEASWLKGLPEELLMCDVDRFVDRIYEPEARRLQIPIRVAKIHRYLCDLNRLPEDVDAGTVQGAPSAAGKFSRGFIWGITTTRQVLLPQPISASLHRSFVDRYYRPFHDSIEAEYRFFREKGFKKIFHLDAHSMPSVGTSEHRDPGERRADIVVSDCHGKSCEVRFKDLVVRAYEGAGFKVAYNWPYFGGRITEIYGRPELGQHAIQVEMNRDLYMDEGTKKLKAGSTEIGRRVGQALETIRNGVPALLN